MFERASNLSRFFALLIDIVVFAVLRYAFSFVSKVIGLSRDLTAEELKFIEEMAAQNKPEELLGATIRLQAEAGVHYEFLAFFIINLIFVIYLVCKKGGTPGKLAMGLEIQDFQTYGRLKWWQAALREFVGKTFLWMITFMIGALVSLVTKNRRGIHDLIASSAVRQKKGA